MIVPVIATRIDKSLFEYSRVTDFELKEIKQYDNGIVWMNYKRLEQAHD